MPMPHIPIAFPHHHHLPEGANILAADIGGTKTDIAIFQVRNGQPVLTKEQRYPSKEWTSLVDIVRDFGQGEQSFSSMCISFAGPIQNGRAHGTNLHWDIDSREISEKLGIENVYLINDLEANCYGLAALTSDDLRTIYPGKNGGTGNAAVLSPGTGLGEGGLFWDGAAYHPFATEGGHTHFAARTELDWELFQFLSKKYGHVSWERVVSGIGICEIFSFMQVIKGRVPSAAFEESSKLHDQAAAIGIAAQAGCPVCEETMQLFVRYLAEEASNLALKMKATGGLYLGGGILPKIWNETYHGIFNQHFFTVGRLNPLVEAVPVYLILNHKTAMLGAGHYGASS